jgi:hypothetical protein
VCSAGGASNGHPEALAIGKSDIVASGTVALIEERHRRVGDALIASLSEQPIDAEQLVADAAATVGMLVRALEPAPWRNEPAPLRYVSPGRALRSRT